MASRRRLTGKDIRKIALLVGLWAIIALLVYSAYYYQQNRRLPVPEFVDVSREARAQEQPPRFLFNINGEGPNLLARPIGVDVSSDGRVYVADIGKRRIAVFSTAGKPLFNFSAIKDGASTVLRNPVHLAIRDDEVWVTDRRLRGIFVFDLEGNYLRKFVPEGETDFAWSPLALAFARDGSLRATDVSDSTAHRVLYFSPDGQRTLTFGETAEVARNDQNPGGFYFPNGIAVARNGDVYIADGNNRRVQIFDKDGKFKRFISTAGVPRGVDFDSTNRFYVVDAVAHQVDIYTADGNRIGKFGSNGFGPGQFNYPNDVAIGPDKRIYVTDRDNAQVQVWGWPVAEPPAIPIPGGPLGWLWCLAPLLLLPLLLLLRRRRYIMTPEWAEALIASDNGDALKDRRVRFVAPQADEARYLTMMLGEQPVSELVTFEGYSDSDAHAIQSRFSITQEQSILLAMARRSRALLSLDETILVPAEELAIRVLDVPGYLAERPLKKDEPEH